MDVIGRFLAALPAGPAALLEVVARDLRAKLQGEPMEGPRAIDALARLGQSAGAPFNEVGRLPRGALTSVTWNAGALEGAFLFTVEGDQITAVAGRWNQV